MNSQPSLSSARTLIGTFLFSLLVTACANGTALVTGVKREPTNPTTIRLVHSIPDGADVIARVEASSDGGFTDQGSLDYAVDELKKQAAKVGANVLVITSTGNSVKGKSVTGLAVFTK
jgi:hypothetical protein